MSLPLLTVTASPVSSARPSFLPEFDACYAPRLAHRARTMRRVFELLEARPGPYALLETGCLREPGNWAGDGQSTFLFDRFLRVHEGRLDAVDLDPRACEVARSVASPHTRVVCAESVRFLWGLKPERPLDLAYLDSFDVDWDRPHPSSLHHLQELAALLPKLGPGSLVVVDDNHAGRGKGEYVRSFMEKLGAELLFDEYQIGWSLPGPRCAP